MQELSKREKVLVYIMVIVVILGGAFLLIKPTVNDYNETSDEREAVNMEYTLARINVNSYDTVMESLENEKKNAQECFDDFPTPLSNDELEQVVLGYVEQAGFYPTETVINSLELMVADYGLDTASEDESAESIEDEETDTETDSDIDDAYDAYEEDASTDDTEGSQPTGGYIRGVISVTMTGAKQNLLSLLEICKDDELIRITALSTYSETEIATNQTTDVGTEEDETVDEDVDGTFTVQGTEASNIYYITFEYYMMESAVF